MKTSKLIKLLTGLAVALSATNSSRAANIIKANNADNLNLTTSWSGGVAPTATDIAVWDGTVLAANTTLLGANASWLGLRVTNPGGAVQINAGSTLTLGANGIDLSAATQNLSLSNAITIGPRYQKWTVASGQALNVFALPTKPHTGVDTAGAVEFSTTGTITLSNNTVARILDSHNNPWATFGKNDWAALNAGQVVAATYTDVTTTLVGGVDNNIVGDLPGGAGSAVDTASIRFNDATPRTLNVANSATTRTFTARGVLVTENSGGATIGGNTAASFIRPNRTTSGAAGGGVSFHFIQNSLIGDLTVSARTSDASSSTPVRLVKSGPGKMILAANAGNGHSAGTVVHEGTLQVNAGASLVTGAVLVNSGRLAVNTASTQNVASITISGVGTNNLTIGAADGVFQSTTLILSNGAPRMEFSWNSGVPVSTTVAPLVVTNFTKNGTVAIDVFAGNLSTGTYPLIKYTTLAGAGNVALGFLPPRIAAHLATNGVNSTIDLVVDSITAPISWATGSSTWDIATSSAWKDATAATTTYQELATPYGSFGDSVRFEDTLSGGSPITVTLNTTVKPASVVAANSSKAYTITGSGSIAGSGGLTKSGSGALTLQTANVFTGAVNLNGGAVVISSLSSLGAGTVINFAGGTLQYASGASDDISARTVTFNSGGATINDGGNFVNFTGPVGNSGVGGLTKTGAGTLMLNGTNRYSGNTLVNQGTLALGGSTYISNSPSITVASVATLDVSAIGLVLNPAVSQVLAGNGTVSGPVVVGTGTSITPGTSVGTLTNSDLTLSGGTYVYEVSTTSRDLIVVNGNVTLNSGTIQVVASGSLTNGIYKLIQYSGALNNGPGSSANLIVSGFAQAGKVATLSDAIPGEIDLVVGTAGGANITWSGSGADWDVETSANWLKAGLPSQFVNGDFVTFDGTGAAQPSVNLPTAVQPGAGSGGVIVNSASDYTFQTAANGKISGPAGLTKNNIGTLTVLTLNNNSGTTVINGGTVQVGNGSFDGDLGTGAVQNNGNLEYRQLVSRTVNGITGSGNLSQLGTTTLTVAGNTGHTGTTTVGAGGTLVLGNGGPLTLASSSVTVNGTLVLDSSANQTLTTPFTGTGGFTKRGTGTLAVNALPGYTGNTAVEGGIATLGAVNVIPGGLRIATGGTVNLNGKDQQVTALTSPSNAGGVLTNSSVGVTNTITVANGATSDSSVSIADGGATGGNIKLVKSGAGQLFLRGGSTYGGGTVVSNGILSVSSTSALGTGPVNLADGVTLELRSSPVGNPINTFGGATATFTSSALGNGWFGTVTSGDATSTNIIAQGISFSSAAAKQFQGFTGTVRIGPSGSLRFSSSTLSVNGGDNTTFMPEGIIVTRNGTGNTVGNGVYLGALTDAPDSATFGFLNGGDGGDGTTTYLIGGKGLSTVFSGTIQGTAPRGTAIVKLGGGSLTLAGTLSYDGSTTVSNGVLVLTGAAELDDSPTISVKSGAVLDVAGIGGTLNLGNVKAQTLSGSGTIRGSVVQNANSQIVPGDSIGILTVTNTVTLGGTNVMEINRTNGVTADKIVAQQGFIISGTPYVVIQNIGSTNFTVGDKFTLFSQPVSGVTISGNLPTLPCAGLTWINKLSVDGSLEVGGSPCVNLTPTNITSTVVGNALDLQWPADHTGWTLQTNAVSVANPAAWFAYPGSTATNRVIIPINPNTANVFFRLFYP